MNANAQNQSSDAFLTEQERTWIKDNPIVKVANNTLNAPFDFAIAGQPAGLSIDYLNLLERKTGLKFEYVTFKDFKSVWNGALNKEVDLIHSLSKNSQREEHLLFSNAYMEVSVASYGQTGSDKIDSIDDLDGKRIGILEFSFVTDIYKKNHPNLNYVVLPNYREAIIALAKNEIDVFTGDAATIEYYISLYDLKSIIVIGDAHEMEDIPYFKHFAVQQEKQTLLNILNKAAASVTNDEFEMIAEKWIKQDKLYHQRDIGLTDEERNWLANNRTIMTASAKDNAPYDFVNEDGEIVGLYGDYLHEISGRLNVQFAWAGNENWSEGLRQIISNEADIVTGATRTTEREEYLIFSEMFIDAQSAIYSRAEGTHFATLESLRGYTLADIRGTADIQLFPVKAYETI